MEKEKIIIDLRTGKKTRVPLKQTLKELREDIGDKLFFQLSPKEREFIALTEGVIDYSEPLWSKVLIKLGLRKTFFERVMTKVSWQKWWRERKNLKEIK